MWSVVEECPDCGQPTLRVFWTQRCDDEPAKRSDEFCDNPNCTRGD